MLIDSYYPLNLQAKGGLTALMIGATLKKQRICEKLILAGADINILSNKGDSCLGQAIMTDNIPLLTFLIKADAELFYIK